MPRLTFRTRLFAALLVVSAIPLSLVTVAGVVLVKASRINEGVRGIDTITVTGRGMMTELSKIDSLLSPAARDAIARHVGAVTQLNAVIAQTPRMEDSIKKVAVVVGLFAALILLVGVALASGWLSRQLAAPLDEVVNWTGRIQRHEPLPKALERGGIPEFAALEAALHSLQASMEQGRAAELEAERLRAFGEVARRVAHEMKNPLTPIRLALLQLSRRAPPEFREELDVIATESARLEAMAREFAELGRLPEGVSAPVDLSELFDDLLKGTVPASMRREFMTDGGSVAIDGYYDPLRRAFSNLLRNAVEACGGQGLIEVALTRRDGSLEIRVSDNGPGISLEKRELIFQPYYTEKGDGTGLGLAIVRQTIEQHRGSISVTETPGGGATFLVRFPA